VAAPPRRRPAGAGSPHRPSAPGGADLPRRVTAGDPARKPGGLGARAVPAAGRHPLHGAMPARKTCCWARRSPAATARRSKG
jgi:hypothetical protein